MTKFYSFKGHLVSWGGRGDVIENIFSLFEFNIFSYTEDKKCTYQKVEYSSERDPIA